jgi:DNA-binding GntR family transcriptional regulator
MATISARIHKVLAQKIIEGTLKPGEKLEERALAIEFDVSRTPVREALRELRARGLVEIKPRSGVVVASIGIDLLSAMLEADGEIESLCARRAAECMTPMEKKELECLFEDAERHIKDDNEEGYLENNQQFHAIICAGARNEVLSQMVTGLRERIAPFRQAQQSIENRLSVSHEEHRAIVKAVLSSDAEGAYCAMRNHNTRINLTVLRLLRHEMEKQHTSQEQEVSNAA